jgi:uncharacterized protein (DUF3084 family)
MQDKPGGFQYSFAGRPVKNFRVVVLFGHSNDTKNESANVENERLQYIEQAFADSNNKFMNEQLNRELNKIDSDIRQAVLDADEFLYSKLNRAREENLQKQFFAETKRLKSELGTLSESRQTALSVREDLTAELKDAADKVFAARSVVYDLEENHGRIANQIYFLDQKAAMDKQSIKDLSKRLETHVKTKLQSEETTND